MDQFEGTNTLVKTGPTGRKESLFLGKTTWEVGLALLGLLAQWTCSMVTMGYRIKIWSWRRAELSPNPRSSPPLYLIGPYMP